jgi:hypothetical protein
VITPTHVTAGNGYGADGRAERILLSREDDEAVHISHGGARDERMPAHYFTI